MALGGRQWSFLKVGVTGTVEPNTHNTPHIATRIADDDPLTLLEETRWFIKVTDSLTAKQEIWVSRAAPRDIGRK
jgi:hypothetical protein